MRHPRSVSRVTRPAGASAESRRYVHVDRLRAFAILIVVCMHINNASGITQGPIPDSIAQAIAGNGYYGVIVFFVISGFLITTNCLRRWGRLGKIDLSDFYAMRLARIAPLLALLVTTLVSLHFARIKLFVIPEDQSVWDMIWHVVTLRYNDYFFMHNDPTEFSWSVLWSLSIEETFYLVFPVVCIAFRREWIVALLLASTMAFGPSSREDGNLYGWWSCADSLSLGCLTALISERWRTARMSSRLAFAIRAAGIAFIATAYLAIPIHENFRRGPPIAAAGSAVFLLGSRYLRPPSAYGLLRTVTGWVAAAYEEFGKRSYELYLFHTLWAISLAEIHGPLDLGSLSVALAVALGACMLIAKFYSEPLNRILRRWLVTMPTSVLEVVSESNLASAWPRGEEMRQPGGSTTARSA